MQHCAALLCLCLIWFIRPALQSGICARYISRYSVSPGWHFLSTYACSTFLLHSDAPNTSFESSAPALTNPRRVHRSSAFSHQSKIQLITVQKSYISIYKCIGMLYTLYMCITFQYIVLYSVYNIFLHSDTSSSHPQSHRSIVSSNHLPSACLHLACTPADTWVCRSQLHALTITTAFSSTSPLSRLALALSSMFLF